jgi:hypothetical protein
MAIFSVFKSAVSLMAVGIAGQNAPKKIHIMRCIVLKVKCVVTPCDLNVIRSDINDTRL